MQRQQEEISKHSTASFDIVPKPYEHINATDDQNFGKMTNAELIPFAERDIDIISSAIRMFKIAVDKQKDVLHQQVEFLNRCSHTTTEPFVRFSPSRSTPLNYKKKLMVDSSTIEMVACNVPPTILRHKPPIVRSTRNVVRSYATEHNESDTEADPFEDVSDDASESVWESFDEEDKENVTTTTAADVTQSMRNATTALNIIEQPKGNRLFSVEQSEIIRNWISKIRDRKRTLTRNQYERLLIEVQKMNEKVTMRQLKTWVSNLARAKVMPTKQRLLTREQLAQLLEWRLADGEDPNQRLSTATLTKLCQRVNTEFGEKLSRKQVSEQYSRFIRQRTTAQPKEEKPRKKLRGKLSVQQKMHIEELMTQCVERFDIDDRKWFGCTRFTDAVVETPNDRSINFAPFSIDDFTRCLDISVVGFLRFHNTDTVLFFVSSNPCIYRYIHHQLENTLNRVGCASWMDAFVSKSLNLDFDNIELVALARTHSIGLQLKWSTAKLFPNCFNVRKKTFAPIVRGWEQYLELLRTYRLELCATEYAAMISSMENLNKIDSTTDYDEIFV